MPAAPAPTPHPSDPILPCCDASRAAGQDTGTGTVRCLGFCGRKAAFCCNVICFPATQRKVRTILLCDVCVDSYLSDASHSAACRVTLPHTAQLKAGPTHHCSPLQTHLQLRSRDGRAGTQAHKLRVPSHMLCMCTCTVAREARSHMLYMCTCTCMHIHMWSRISASSWLSASETSATSPGLTKRRVHSSR